jgi:hypothetical protein
MTDKLKTWRGMPSLAVTEYGGLEQSLVFEVHGVRLPRSTEADYAKFFVARGDISDPAELRSALHLVAEVQAHWHNSLANACVFSAQLSQRRAEYGWRTVVAGGSADAAQLAETIVKEVAAAIEDADAELLSVVAADITSSQELAALLVALSRSHGWRLFADGVEPDDAFGELTRLSARVAMGHESESEVIGFAPFPTLARTRQTPFVELALRTKLLDETRARQKRVLLAQVPLQNAPPGAGQAWHKQTMQLRSQILSRDHDLRGKARIAFTLPSSEWKAAQGSA